MRYLAYIRQFFWVSARSTILARLLQMVEQNKNNLNKG